MELSSRIKEYYEDRTKQFLPRRMLTCIRLDGKGFSKFTKKMNKPFDDGFSDDMDATALFLCEEIQGAKFAYTQSDEITVVLHDYENNESQAWFDYNVQKMVSIASSLATAKFNQLRMIRACNNADGDLRENMLADYEIESMTLAMFDARVFQVPTVDEMINTIIWRQQDCTRNSISMAASAVYPHKELEKKTSSEKQDMLMEKGINWNNYKTKYKRGSVISKQKITKEGTNGLPVTRNKWVIDDEMPIITQNKDYLRKIVEITE